MHHVNAPSHASFLPGNFFYQQQHDYRLHTPYFSLFPRLKIKLKGRHFDATEVIEEELQALLNTLRKHDFQNAFKMAAALAKRNDDQ
jgi:hypothetical protein